MRSKLQERYLFVGGDHNGKSMFASGDQRIALSKKQERFPFNGPDVGFRRNIETYSPVTVTISISRDAIGHTIRRVIYVADELTHTAAMDMIKKLFLNEETMRKALHTP